MTVIQRLIPINNYSRPGKKRTETKGIVLHNVGVAGQRAKDVIEYFCSLANQKDDNKPDVSASAHYVIDQDGTIYQCIPDDEKAYHVGSTIKDPKSGLIYTDLARASFGAYASKPLIMSPNSCTIGIEMCHGPMGEISAQTYSAALNLCLSLMKKYNLTVTSIFTHKDVVGWKECPLLWTKEPQRFVSFKLDLRRLSCL